MTNNKKRIKKTKKALATDDLKTLKAKIALRPHANAAAVITEYGATFGEQDLTALSQSLSESVKKVSAGNMEDCEAMLISQAHALQSIFMNLSRRAIGQEYLSNFEVFLKMALKAQGQCRATLETLAAVKNPPIVFARQANISQGHQQINNGNNSVGDSTRVEKNKN